VFGAAVPHIDSSLGGGGACSSTTPREKAGRAELAAWAGEAAGSPLLQCNQHGLWVDGTSNQYYVVGLFF